MDNLDFGPGLGIIMLSYLCILNLVRSMACVLAAHFMALRMQKAVTLFPLQPGSSEAGTLQFFQYELWFIVILPALNSLANLFFRVDMVIFSNFSPYSTQILLSLTFWHFSQRENEWHLLTLGLIIRRSFVFLLTGLIISLLFEATLTVISGIFLNIISVVIQQGILLYLTLFYVRKNYTGTHSLNID